MDPLLGICKTKSAALDLVLGTLAKDTDLASTLQWKAIKTVRGPETRTYKRRLGEIGLFT